MTTGMGNMALDGGDPRLSMGEGQITVPTAIRRKLHDPNVKFEEYLYYAKIQREQEARGLDPADRARIAAGAPESELVSENDEKKSGEKASDETSPKNLVAAGDPVISSDEWELASRAGRNASWAAVVYLITTDILGPTSAPYAVSTFGYGGGVLMYFFLGMMAFFAGWQIWRMFLKLDSDRYPMRTFGDLGFRIFGTSTRHAMNVLQSIQLVCNVGVIILGNGQGLSQMAKFKLCFAICNLVWTLAGMILGQIRTLQKFGYLANFAIWLNVLVIFMTMGEAAHSKPNYAATAAAAADPTTWGTAPVVANAWSPITGGFNDQIAAAMNIVYAYGGAMLYCEFMAEMKRPLDFIKAQFVAETFIFACYLVFGVVVYSQQGQYVVNPANQGLSNYGWQTATNALSLSSGLIAAVLYGNIGIKVIYQNLVQDLFGGPNLNTKKGKMLWVGMVPMYWAIAFVIPSAIPQFSYLTSLVAAICIMQFTYTFPAILYLGMHIQEDAIHPEETFDPATGVVHRIDTWRDLSRWRRGLKNQWWLKLFCFLFFLASAATAIMGLYGSCAGLKNAYSGGAITSFSCHSPVQG